MSDKPPARPIEALWLIFQARCIPANSGPVQRQCMRDAFYAGAVALFSSLHETVSEGEVATDGDLALMADIEAELTTYPYPERRLEEPA